jgi:peptide-methionine (S)-S-oxide reductase
VRQTAGCGIPVVPVDKSRKLVRMQLSDGQGSSRTEVATLGGGCFWCLEAVYEELRGVEKVESGYTGGAVPNPTYRQVCTGTTGHAEVVQVTFDPEVVSFREILEIFFTIHDPTTLNRQGADVGTQYRSAIFYHDEEQKRVAEEVVAELEEAHLWNDPIVTEVKPFDTFYVAEDYHQGYYRNNEYQPYCQVVIAPKVAKFRKRYLERLKA